MVAAAISQVRVHDLLARYDGVLLDAYGVLVDATGALPGARELVAAAQARKVPLCVVTNDASRSPAQLAARYANLGLAIGVHEILTAGEMLVPYFANRVGAKTLVLGTPQSEAWVEQGGGVVVPLGPGAEASVIAICDDQGFDFLRGLEWAVSTAMRALERGAPMEIVVANPDLIYPKARGEFGVTAGSLALLLQSIVKRRLGVELPTTVVGKPAPAIFQTACKRLGVTRPLVIGDQMETDVAGAHAVGLDVALVHGVSTRVPEGLRPPTFELRDLL